MHEINAVIVDDERLARNRLRRLLALDPRIRVFAECVNGMEAVDLLRRQSPDLLFLDIQMPGMDGFEVLRSVQSDRLPVVVFVTACDSYALRAFEFHAFDYLLKPLDRRRFRETLDRAKYQVNLLRHGQINTPLLDLLRNLDRLRQDNSRIAVRSAGNVLLLEAASIDWVEAADNYIRLHCGPRTHLVRETMNSFEQRVDLDRFARIHRSTVVNLDRVRAVKPARRGDHHVMLADGTELVLSRTYRDRVGGRLLKSG